jgi:nicotinamide-nucleotide amidase
MEELYKLAEQLVNIAKDKGIKLSMAESCTGGMVATAITSVAGSSAMFDCGFVTYSYEAKEKILGVKKQTLQNYGAVSSECVVEMCIGALQKSGADIAVSISGIAGPSGGLPNKPVGTVFFAVSQNIESKIQTPTTSVKIFSGNRDEVRIKSSIYALTLLRDNIL